MRFISVLAAVILAAFAQAQEVGIGKFKIGAKISDIRDLDGVRKTVLNSYVNRKMRDENMACEFVPDTSTSITYWNSTFSREKAAVSSLGKFRVFALRDRRINDAIKLSDVFLLFSDSTLIEVRIFFEGYCQRFTLDALEIKYGAPVKDGSRLDWNLGDAYISCPDISQDYIRICSKNADIEIDEYMKIKDAVYRSMLNREEEARKKRLLEDF